MKILLIGHSIVDHLDVNGEELTKPGGIYYSTLGMLSKSSCEDEIYLLTGMNDKYSHLFKSVYSKVNSSISLVLDEMPEVFLIIHPTQERDETYKNLSSSLDLELITNSNIFNGILINMITGFDISIDQLTDLRKKFNGMIYFDLHTLTRGVDDKMNRNFRPIPDVEKWLSNIDILQCNENELQTVFTGAKEKVIEKIFEFRPRIVLVTKGEKGATAYSKSEYKINKFEVEAEEVTVKNKIGCGDIFGAVFFYSYLDSLNIENSLITANNAASIAVANDIIKNPKALLNV